MAHNYHKIYAPFKREGLKDKYVKIGLWQTAALEYVQRLNWEWTEKIDGTSIGVKWDGERISFVGHTEKSQIPNNLMNYLRNKFGTSEAESMFESTFGETNVTLYGEGISKETNYSYGYPDGNFIFYDIFCDTSNQFWSRDTVHDIAKKFELAEPAVILTGSVMDAIHFIQEPRKQSKLDPSIPMEGLVGRPLVELTAANGQRIITKIKYCDYAPLNTVNEPSA